MEESCLHAFWFIALLHTIFFKNSLNSQYSMQCSRWCHDKRQWCLDMRLFGWMLDSHFVKSFAEYCGISAIFMLRKLNLQSTLLIQYSSYTSGLAIILQVCKYNCRRNSFIVHIPVCDVILYSDWPVSTSHAKFLGLWPEEHKWSSQETDQYCTRRRLRFFWQYLSEGGETKDWFRRFFCAIVENCAQKFVRVIENRIESQSKTSLA
jgi:hypothetical protein